MHKGSVINNNLQCPYHGWEFDKNGNLCNVPSIQEGNLPKCALDSKKVIEHGGFLWTGDQINEDYLPTQLCPELHDERWHKIYGSKIVKGNFLDWISNSLDLSHINFVHSFGNENDGTVMFDNIQNVNTDTFSTLQCKAYVQPKASSLFTEHMQVKKAPVDATFIFPNTTVIKIKLKEPYEFVTFTTVTPINTYENIFSFAFLHNINLYDPIAQRMVNNKFKSEMYKTVEEDEAIISRLSIIDPQDYVNVACDKFQLKALKQLKNYI